MTSFLELNLGGICFVILGMRTDELNISNPVGVVELHNQAIFVTGNVEYDTIAGNQTGVAEVAFDVCGFFPIGIPGKVVPGPER